MTVSTATTWRPLLTGTLAERATETIGEIASVLRALEPSAIEDCSLVSGNAGIALFHAYLARAAPGEGHEEVARRHLEPAAEALAREPMAPDLYSGFSGVAWTIEHLAAQLGLGEGEEDLNQPIDEAILEGLRQACPDAAWWQRYELIMGLAGLAVYALERMPRPGAVRMLERIVDTLDAVSERAPDGITWRTEPEQLPLLSRRQTPSGNYNLGVAHGVPGVIGVLGQIAAAGIALPQSRALLDGAVSWLLAQRLPPGGPAEFQAWISPDGSPPADRVAWCYGNPGIAVVLLGAARAVGEPAWESEALDLASACARRDFRDSLVVEASVCHGSAGNGHLFNRMYQATGDERLRDAALTWFAQTFEFYQPGRGLAGFATQGLDSEERTVWLGQPGLLTGIAGIGLTLLAASTEVEPAWDRVLLAALPVRR